MKPFPLLVLSAAMAALALASTEATAQQHSVSSGARNSFPSPSHSNAFSWERGHGFHGGFGNVWVVEREVPVIVERVVQAPPPPNPLTLPSPPGGEGKAARKPYVIGATYASLPGGCMKLIEDGVSFFYCSGEWYRQEGKSYRAVARRL